MLSFRYEVAQWSYVATVALAPWAATRPRQRPNRQRNRSQNPLGRASGRIVVQAQLGSGDLTCTSRWPVQSRPASRPRNSSPLNGVHTTARRGSVSGAWLTTCPPIRPPVLRQRKLRWAGRFVGKHPSSAGAYGCAARGADQPCHSVRVGLRINLTPSLPPPAQRRVGGIENRTMHRAEVVAAKGPPRAPRRPVRLRGTPPSHPPP